MEKGDRLQIRLKDNARVEVELIGFSGSLMAIRYLSDLEQGLDIPYTLNLGKIQDILTIE